MNKLKRISKSFILANIFDVITTALAISAGGYETNPVVVHFGWIVGGLSKLIAVIAIVIILENGKVHKMYWILPVILWAVSIWNMLQFIVLLPVAGCALILLIAWIWMAISLFELVKEIGIKKAIGYIVIYPLLIAGTIILYMKLYL